MTGNELKDARQKLGLSQRALSDAIDMSRVMIVLMEHGKKRIEKRTELAVLCLLYEAGIKSAKHYNAMEINNVQL